MGNTSGHENTGVGGGATAVVASRQLGPLLARLVSCITPTPRCAVLLGPSRNASSPLFVLLYTILCGSCLFHLLATKVKKTNKKPKNYIIKRNKN